MIPLVSGLYSENYCSTYTFWPRACRWILNGEFSEWCRWWWVWLLLLFGPCEPGQEQLYHSVITLNANSAENRDSQSFWQGSLRLSVPSPVFAHKIYYSPLTPKHREVICLVHDYIGVNGSTRTRTLTSGFPMLSMTMKLTLILTASSLLSDQMSTWFQIDIFQWSFGWKD